MDQKMIRKIKPEMMKMAPLTLLITDCVNYFGDCGTWHWYSWCAWRNTWSEHVISTNVVGDTVGERDSKSDLVDLIQRERARDQYQLDMASQFIQNQVVVIRVVARFF